MAAVMRPVVLGWLCSCFGVAAIADCNIPQTADCHNLCTALANCHYLPSLLGADGPNMSPLAESDCESRCGLSASQPIYPQIHDCYQASNNGAACGVFAACLHGDFPDSPVTGVSRVELRGYVGPPGRAAQPAACGNTLLPASGDVPPDAGPLSGCMQDAGPQVSFVRGFVDEWGARQYSDTVTCGTPIIAVFENVPANDDGVQMGLQISQGSVCVEYDVTNPVAADCDDLDVLVNLANPPVACRPDRPTDAGATEAAPLAAQQGPGEAGDP